MTTLLFPVFRKYKNDKSYFKIEDPQSFEEINIMGKSFTIIRHTAKILPDRNLLMDMLYDYHTYWDEITANEYADKLQLCRKTLREII